MNDREKLDEVGSFGNITSSRAYFHGYEDGKAAARREALEEAAAVAEKWTTHWNIGNAFEITDKDTGRDIGKAIRALIDAPQGGEK